MDHRTGAFIAASSLALTTMAACSDRFPTAPTDRTSSTMTPSISAVEPNTSPTSGTILVNILGTGFQPGALVTLGGPANDVTVVSNRLIRARVPPHPAGTVDVVVTNPGASTGILAGGFTYVVLQSLAVTALTPDIGSTEGGTPVTIRGTAFHQSLTVRFGGIAVTPFVYQGSIYVTAPAHPAGRVDVVVTNPGTQPHTVSGGYTYAPPDSFDFNGTWHGDAGSEWEFPLQFTIEDNVVTRVRCDGTEVSAFNPPPRVRNGAFSFSAEGGTMTGAIVSPGRARGVIDIGACTRVSWYAATP